MPQLTCLWNRPRLERYADGTLGLSVTQSVKNHLNHCSDCRDRVEGLAHLKALVRSALPEVAEPDWTGFWAGIDARLSSEEPRRIQPDPWWMPFWRPVWGHPRLAMGSVMVVALVAVLSLWPLPGRQGGMPVAWAGPVVVQDVDTPDPDGSVMVYSTPDQAPEQALTVIWLFSPAGSSEES